MGKYLSNGKGVVGVRTRAKARAAAIALSSSSSSMVVKMMKKVSNKVSDLQNRRRIPVVSDENFLPKTVVINSSSNSSSSEVVETAVGHSSGDDVSCELPASCCSSNDNASIPTRIVVDPEVESGETTWSRHLNLDNNDEERRESEVETVESENVVSPLMRPRVKKSTVQIKMPLDSEIDSFFVGAEKDIHKCFADRYNFDLVKDMPLEGRYEWEPIKPLIQ